MTHIFTNQTIKNIVTFLKKYNNDDMLINIYQWPIDKAIGELISLDSNSEIHFQSKRNVYKKTITAKEIVKEKLFSDISDDDKQKYVLWIIKDWGGIKTVNKKTIFESIKEKEKNKSNNKESFDCKSIASWSKYFAFKYPEEYAIYDARVIYSLNWLLFQHNSDFFFPSPNGRNSLMKALDYELLILTKKHSAEHIKKEIDKDIENRNKTPGSKSRVISNLKKKCYIKDKSAYLTYCRLLKSVAVMLYGENDTLALTKTEMILFAIADKDIAEDVFAKLTCLESNAVITNSITDDINDNLIDHDIRNTMENLNFGVIRVSYDVDTATITISASDGIQEEFERSLRELLEWLSAANSITEIIFQAGGGGCVFILPDWFKQACAQANIQIRYNLTLWNQVFVGFRVPAGHNFTNVISFYRDFRHNYPCNTITAEFIDWQVNTLGIPIVTAHSNCFSWGLGQMNISVLTDAEVQMLANQPTSVHAQAFLTRWQQCDVNVALPTCLADAYIAGHVVNLGLVGQAAANQIVAYGLAGSPNSANTLLTTGRSLGRHFGLLTQNNQPTAFFHQYFN